MDDRWALRLRPLDNFGAPFLREPAARSRSGLSEVIKPSTIEDMLRIILLEEINVWRNRFTDGRRIKESSDTRWDAFLT